MCSIARDGAVDQRERATIVDAAAVSRCVTRDGAVDQHKCTIIGDEGGELVVLEGQARNSDRVSIDHMNIKATSAAANGEDPCAWATNSQVLGNDKITACEHD